MKCLKRLPDGRVGLDFTYSYPHNPDWIFTTELERINFDEERVQDIRSGNGFIVSPTNGIKKDLKDDHSIFSSKYGNNLSDQDQFQNTFRCKCGMTRSKINLGLKCKFCGQKVENVETNPRYTGWIVIQSDDFFVIHCNLFKSIEFLIGKTELDSIIKYDAQIDEDGHIHIIENEDQPFYGIGMVEFHNRFDEIMDYYKAKFPNKIEYYKNIMENRDKVFTQSIPVFSTMLRPFNEDKESFYFEESNAIYTKINKLVSELNFAKSKFNSNKKIKPTAQLLYDIQVEFMKLYDNIVTICEGKKGTIRSLFAGRYNFTGRCVIVSNPKLRNDQVLLSYNSLVELLHASIINILKKSYNLSSQDAYNRWYAAKINTDPLIVRIIESMIKKHKSGKGIPIIINRNPTINYGSILQMYCVGITYSYTMELPLGVLVSLGADFDGDTLNIWYIINDEFYRAANRVFNPAKSMYISRNDGSFDNRLNHQRDVIINTNTFVSLGRKLYTPDELVQLQKMSKN